MRRFWVGLLALTLSGCNEWLAGPLTVPSWKESRELVVLVPNGPTTLFVDAAGAYAGLEYDLANQFATSNGLKVRFIVTGSQAEAIERLQRHEGHMAAGVLKSDLHKQPHGSVYKEVQPVLIYPKDRADEDGALPTEQMTLTAMPEYAAIVEVVKNTQPGMLREIYAEVDAEALFERVANGDAPLALVDGHTADVMKNYYPRVASQRVEGQKLALSWALQAGDDDLLQEVNRFFAEAKRQQLVARLSERYYGHVNRLDPPDAMAFLQNIQKKLPALRNWFYEAEANTGLDWRLVAALAYQESHWVADATSPYGVRGMMMLTQDTAQSLGVDRLDPYQSIQGGARYIRSLIKTIPDRVPEPDRTWMALAAYNVGRSHLEDARILAERLQKNPDSWADVKSTLPLLRNPEYFRTVKYGYARGGEPVIFVESLRTYFDILARFEKPYQPKPAELR